jgi:N-methylhydantoinase A/oxoprolinase/acetone carboxylase beta subunit
LLPISLIALDAPELVHDVLDRQLGTTTPGDHDARFARRVPGQPPVGLDTRETNLLERIGEGIRPLGEVLRNRIEAKSLRRLVERGLVQVAGVTPSDASHVLGKVDVWDKDAAEKALLLFGRRRTGAGNKLAETAQEMATIIIDQLTDQTKWALLETAFSEESQDFEGTSTDLARSKMLAAALDGHRGILRLDAGLNLPVIGLGASAKSYYPAVGEALNCEMVLPEHAGVANAIGAVVGQVTIRKRGTVTSPSEGRYRVHLDGDPEDFAASDQAMNHLEDWLRTHALKDAKSAGAEGIQVAAFRDVKSAVAENREVFIEAEILVEASGRPRIAAE